MPEAAEIGRIFQNGSTSHPPMPTLTLKNVPDDLHRRLKAVATQNHRSLNREAIRRLEASLNVTDPPAVDEAWEQVTALRKEMAAEGVWVTAEQVLASIDEGRR